MRVVNCSVADLRGRQRLPAPHAGSHCRSDVSQEPSHSQKTCNPKPWWSATTPHVHLQVTPALNGEHMRAFERRLHWQWEKKTTKHTIKRMCSLSLVTSTHTILCTEECPYYPGGHNQPASLVFSPTLTGFTLTSALTRAVGVNCPLWLSILERLCDKSKLLNIKCASIFHLSKRDVWMSWHF